MIKSFASSLRSFAFAALTFTFLVNTAFADNGNNTNASPTLSAQQVVVANSNLQPVPVTGAVVIVQSGLPVQINLPLSFSYDAIAPQVSYTIPAGKRLVIEHLAYRCEFLGAIARDVDVRLGTGANTSLTWLPASAKVYSQNFRLWALAFAAMPVHVIVDGGSIWVDGDSSSYNQGLGTCEVSVLGYLTPIPQQPN